MIARLTGTVVDREEKGLILDVQGVGYRVAALRELRERVKIGAELTLRIHHHVAADDEVLYGFDRQEALRFFELLLTVPSVGPRTAMSILEIAPPPVLAQAISEKNTALLTKVAGVGRKTAERIVVELKEKLAKTSVVGVPSGVQEETVGALVSMGYSLTQARALISTLPASVTSAEEAIRFTLKAKVP